MRAHGLCLVAESVRALFVDAVHFKENATAQMQALQAGAKPIPLSDAEIEQIRRALALAMESGFPTKESVKFLLAKAQAQALALAARAPDAVDEETRKQLGGGGRKAAPAKGPEKAEKKEEKPSEEEAAAGLGSLFG